VSSPSADRFDVAVVGGGAAGLAASLTAARFGARVLLLERENRLGGNMTLSLVHTICGLYRPETSRPRHLHAGFPVAFARSLRRHDLAAAPESVGRVYVLPTYPHAMPDFLRGLCRARRGLTVHTRARFEGARFDSDGVRIDWSGPEDDTKRRVRVALLVDASGDAVTAPDDGRQMAEPDRLQIPSLIFMVEGVDRARTEGYASLRVTRAVARAARENHLPEDADSILVRPGRDEDTAYVTLNLPRPEQGDFNPLDPDQVAALDERARQRARRVVAFLRENREGFEDCSIVRWPRRLGIRETRRLRTRYTLTGEDLLSGRSFEDRVARSGWPLELWHDHRRPTLQHPEGPADVPLRALVSERHPRLAAAGRCMGATHEALGALRVLGCALATGQAAGTAAARAADRGCTLGDVDAASVRDMLRATHPPLDPEETRP